MNGKLEDGSEFTYKIEFSFIDFYQPDLVELDLSGLVETLCVQSIVIWDTSLKEIDLGRSTERGQRWTGVLICCLVPRDRITSRGGWVMSYSLSTCLLCLRATHGGKIINQTQ